MSASYKRLRKFIEIRSANYRSRPGVIEHVYEWIGPDAVQHDLTEHDLEQLLAEYSAAVDELGKLRAEREEMREEWATRKSGFGVSLPYSREAIPMILRLNPGAVAVRRLVSDWRKADPAPQQPEPDGGEPR